MFSRLLSAALVLLLAGAVFAAEVKPIPPPGIPIPDADRAALTADLVGDAPPTYSRGTDGIVNTMTVDFPAAQVKYTFTDQTSRAAYGPSQSTIEVTVPGGLFGRAIGGAELTTTLAAVAMSTLGPLRFCSHARHWLSQPSISGAINTTSRVWVSCDRKAAM